ncbi:hypothetical protein [Limnohabitans radicicola]|uniref:Peptidase metallopeptidase domain-containing protein n=1 Tax=Limnohabitans radicicola TaxID=2771427 RepID=A0A927IKT0_9BURK|nr:hypothetical protein [Limnohabitans radicicola]MBD8049192.1 hypothetical protein [Limnohabitans radicicola]
MGIASLSKNPYALTGNSIIDATTNGYKWYFPAGASQVLNWSVSSSAWSHPSLQTSAIQKNFTQAFANIAEFIDVTFNFLGYVDGSGNKYGYENARLQGSDMNITFAYEGLTSSGFLLSDKKFTSASATAFCYFPDADLDTLEYFGAPGDTWLNYNNPFISSRNFNVGTNGFQLLSHEILHGLGLKHPHDSGGTGRPTYTQLGIQFADRQWVSIMSYDLTKNGGDSAYQGSQPIGPMIYDAIALQFLYGESKFNSGNTTYDINQYLGNYYNCQWDASGTDTLNGANLTYGVVVDLGYEKESNGSKIHNVGFITTWLDSLNLSDNGTNPEKWTWLWGEYENIIGSNFNDIFNGNDFNNDINGGSGDDYMSGREGDDRFDWDSSQRGGADTMVGGLGNDIYVLDSVYDNIIELGGEGVDTVYVGFNYSITNTFLENIRTFSDQTTPLVFTGNSWNNIIVSGDGADTIYGNEGDDTLTGGNGSDFINGGVGTDTASWTRKAVNFQLIKVAGGWQVKDKTGTEGTDTVSNVERLQFADKNVIIDSNAHVSYANLPVGLYQFFITAFNAAPGVTYMDQLAAAYGAGMSVKQIVDVFTTKSQFTDMYPTGMSNAQLAQALVNNIVKTSASDATKQQAVKDITDAMSNAKWTVGQVIYQVFGNLTNFAYTDPTWGNTAKQFANEIAVAKTYTDTLSQSTTDLATLRSVMAPVSHLTDVSTPELQITLIGQALMG